MGLKESLRFDGPDNLRPSVEEFERTAQKAEQAAFKGLIIDTMTLHRRGLGVLDPDRAPKPVSSPFVRRMPEDQSEIEAKRFETQGRHMEAYELHILQAFEHFVQAWTALIDGSLICDWEMIDDEFPKLATLAAEVNRAYVIWSSKNR
ncbi:hypothetical protein MXD62_16925 [Frankia sp. Mgl5]|uniref:hypothetical protein n=1 Tax=Frankia sp. Mgl5 TaxID=2933793 RepID=UPI00200E5267|nr:hypothetical protein [Frankia sp. Mgl5]MCK9928841.1 hypothetical protein [Frankia sp. Mgl5]